MNIQIFIIIQIMIINLIMINFFFLYFQKTLMLYF